MLSLQNTVSHVKIYLRCQIWEDTHSGKVEESSALSRFFISFTDFKIKEILVLVCLRCPGAYPAIAIFIFFAKL